MRIVLLSLIVFISGCTTTLTDLRDDVRAFESKIKALEIEIDVYCKETTDAVELALCEKIDQ